MHPALSLENLSKTFAHGKTAVMAVDDVSLEIAAGEFFTLLGPSGCGKTTLLRLIAGLETANRGRIVLTGDDVTQLPAHKRPVNTVFQNYALFPHMNVAENVGFGLKMQGRSNARAVAAALSLVQMEGMETRKPAQLSGGQQQRVALARALVNRPKILLLDESLSALDYQLRKDMRLELKRLQRDTGITFVFVTHDQDEALSMSDRIAVMNGGKVAQVGTPGDIYARPASRFVAGFVGTCNFIPASLAGEAGEDVGFRPEDVTFAAQGGMAGRVTDVSYRGAVTHCTVRLESGHDIVAQAPPHVRQGDEVRVAIAPERLIKCGA